MKKTKNTLWGIAGLAFLLSVVIGVSVVLWNFEYQEEEIANRMRSYYTVDDAEEVVRQRAEVQEYLGKVPDGIVAFDHEASGKFVIHVYEIRDDHMATLNWYDFNLDTGEVTPIF